MRQGIRDGNRLWVTPLLLILWLAGCGGGGSSTPFRFTGGSNNGTPGIVVPGNPPPLTVIAVDPANASPGVATNKSVTVTFSRPMDPATLNNTNFTLTANGAAISGVVTHTAQNDAATFTPTANLQTNTTYTVAVSAAATDPAGNALTPFSSTFTTAVAVTIVHPFVQSINPANQASQVAINRKITAVFNTAMDPTTINTPAVTFTLTDGGNVSGTVTYDVATKTATFTPSANLAINTTFTVNLTAGATDLAGNTLTPFTSTFTTGSQVGQAPVALGGTLTNFAVLGGSTVTNANATTVTGDLGVSPGSAVTGFPPGILIGIFHNGDATAAQAQVDLTAAFNDAKNRGGAPVTVAGDLGGQTLLPGLYNSTSSLAISSGDLTLDAKGDSAAVFVFQMASTFTSTTGRQIFLAGGATSANVFWEVGSSATLGSSSHFVGTILADTSITVVSGASVDGRVVCRSGAVTLDANAITRPVL